MGYQTGTVGPITYYQDNSGNATDIDTQINYTPEQFGAPPGAQIMTGTVQVNQFVSRGKAYVHDESDTADAISFEVYTQAANDSWFFGWHSGAITVTTSFQWWYISDNALEGGHAFFTQEAPAVLPNAA
jgi:hypothetical protein